MRLIASALYSVANDDLKTGVQCVAFGKTIARVHPSAKVVGQRADPTISRR